MKFGQKQPKMAFLRFLVKIDPATWDHKFRSKHRKNIPSSVFESLGSILSVFNIFIIFSCLFVTKTVFQPLYAYFAYGKLIYRFGYKKASKTQNFASTKLNLKSTRPELSKSGLRMFIRPLVMILWKFLAYVKNAIF